MRSITLMLLSLILSGCQINPYTFQPGWTSPDWFTAGKEDAMNGVPVKITRRWPIVLMTLRLIEGNIFVVTLTDRKKYAKRALFTPGD